MIGQPNREGFHTITPYLRVPEIDPVIQFLQQAFRATETYRGTGGGGGIHLEMRIGNSMLMIGSGSTITETVPATFFLYVEDVDGVYQSALDAGAASLLEPADGLFGEKRGAGVKDPFGIDWFFGRH
ncbi:MAG: VOC family protein [Candidatus Promineifilaceae bacterium]